MQHNVSTVARSIRLIESEHRSISRSRAYSPWDVILGRAPPPLGIFADSDFLKGYSMLNSLQVVCTLAMAALRKSGNPKFEKMLKSVIRLMTAISS